eukprot:10606722-Ditylum_brightwellii.AAC.1
MVQYSLERASNALNQWIMVVAESANRTVPGKGECRDMILYRYRITPQYLSKTCDGYRKKHILNNVLQCK